MVMNLKARFSLIGAGIIIFLIVMPLLVLYARGFKYDFTQRKLIKTGTMVIKSDPGGATIYLDNQKQKAKTAAVMRFLSPKEYDVRVEKAGYQTWTKRLAVNAQYVTWTAANRDAISLFYGAPKPEQTWSAASVSLSANKDEIIFIDPNNLAQSLSVNSGQTTTLGPLPDLIFPNLTNALTRWTNAAKNFETVISKNRDEVPAAIISQISAAESDGNHIIFISGGNLYSYNSNQLKLIEYKVAAATLGSDGIWYATATELKYLGFGLTEPKIILTSLPAFTAASLLWADNRIFITLNQILYAFNEVLEPIYSHATLVEWDKASGQLLYGNANELQLYNPNTKKSQLVLRSINAVVHPLLNAASGYLFYLQDSAVKAIELDNRNGQNLYTILDHVASNAIFTISNDGQRLYVFADGKLSEFTIR